MVTLVTACCPIYKYKVRPRGTAVFYTRSQYWSHHCDYLCTAVSAAHSSESAVR